MSQSLPESAHGEVGMVVEGENAVARVQDADHAVVDLNRIYV